MNDTPEKLVAISRYQNYFPTLSAEIAAGIIVLLFRRKLVV